MDTVLDTVAGQSITAFSHKVSTTPDDWPAWQDAAGDRLPLAEIAGLTPWDASAPAKQQIRVAGSLHALAGTGTLAMLLPADQTFTAEQADEPLAFCLATVGG